MTATVPVSVGPTLSLTRPQSSVFLSDRRFRVLVAGRRFGKTHLAIPELLRWAWGPGKAAWYIAPTYKQAKMIAWEKLKAIAGPWIAKTNESELSVKLVTGGTVRLHGAEKYDSLRGPGLDGVAFDEFADIDLRAWTEVVRPMLSDRKGGALFIGTPKGFNHFRDMHSSALTDIEAWGGWTFTTIQGGNVEPAEVEAARRDLDERSFRQEYEASFEDMFSGRVYYAFSRAENAATPLAYDAQLPLCWSLDFNVTPMCSVIAQVDRTDVDFYGARRPVLNVLEEIVISDSNVWEVCQAFAKRTEAWVKRAGTLTVRIYGDATGNNREHTGPSSYAMIREFFSTRPEYRISLHHSGRANPGVTDRVNAVNAMACNADGERRLMVDPIKCRNLVTDLERVGWKMDATGNATGTMDQRGPSKDIPAGLTHVSDALGYLIETEFGIRTKGGPRSTFVA